MRRRRSGALVVLCVLAWAGAPARGGPPRGEYEPFRVRTDNVPQAEIAGWLLPARGTGKGTLFMFHGYNNDKGHLAHWEWVRDELNWNVLMSDFREHGESSKSGHLSTLGYYEIWDVKAVIDFAEARGLPKPYVIYGRSLGAATGLRWAGMDPRVTGVYAVSPFKNAYVASKQMTGYKLKIGSGFSPFALHPGYRQMLQAVDIPAAVAKRDDLRIWILVGEFDSFPESDEREILAASRSPAEMKRLVIGKGLNHHNAMSWAGGPGQPGHDEGLRQFLSACRSGEWDEEGRLIALVGLGVVVMLMGLIVFAKRMREAGWGEGPVEGNKAD